MSVEKNTLIIDGDYYKYNNDKPPLVTVAMPVYNGGKHLQLAVLSIVKQSFTDWELIIIDDGSTDNALQDIADINDARISIIRDGRNKGIAVRLNEIIDLARGQYFARMDADDVSYPERFSRQLEVLQNAPELDLVATRAITIDEDNYVTGGFPYSLSHFEICAKPWKGFYFPHPTWMGKTEWFRKYRYTVPAPYYCEDQELLLRSYQESQFATLDSVLFAYRIGESIDKNKLKKARQTIAKIQFRYFGEKRQWGFALLSISTLILKRISDHLQLTRTMTYLISPRTLDDEPCLEWRSILAGLVDKQKTNETE